jgi:hypothetical protein
LRVLSFSTGDKPKIPQHSWPTDLLDHLKAVVVRPSRAMKNPEFRFKLTKECAEWNFPVFKKYGFDLEKALEAQRGTPLEYGSEFRTVSGKLEPIFKYHPLWTHMKENLATGAIFPLAELDEETRLSDFQAALDKGNHKGAKKKPDLLLKLVEKDVVHGYGLPLPLPKLSRIPSVDLAPMNIQAQNTINEFGQIIEKDRHTHDQSFDFSPDSSVNSQIIWDDLPPVRYGQYMRRIINRAVATRLKYPNKKILASKVDYKSAYTGGSIWHDRLLSKHVHSSRNEK